MSDLGESDDTLPGLDELEDDDDAGEDLDDEDLDAELATCALCGMPVNPDELTRSEPPYYCPTCDGTGEERLDLDVTGGV